jgi:hypothetical protein
MCDTTTAETFSDEIFWPFSVGQGGNADYEDVSPGATATVIGSS